MFVPREQVVYESVELAIRVVAPNLKTQLKGFNGHLRAAPYTDYTKFQVNIETVLNQAPSVCSFVNPSGEEK